MEVLNLNRQLNNKTSSSTARELKAQIVSELHEKFSKARGMIFANYKGLTSQDVFDLRKTLRTADLEYKVVKNTLAKRAAEGTPVEAVKNILTGPVGIVIGYDDPVITAKKVLEFVKTNNKFEIKGGVIEGKVCKAEDVKTISVLPSREILLSMFIGALRSPLSKLAGAMNATLLKFAYAMEALKNKKGVSEQ